MNTRQLRLLLSGVLVLGGLLAGSASLAIIPPPPGLPTFLFDDFDPPRGEWQPASGAWSFQDGHYVDTSAGDDITTIVTYYDPFYPSEPTNYVPYDGYVVHAMMRNPGVSDAQRVGLVYQYQDAANYYEALVSATGTVSLQRVVGGVRTQIGSTFLGVDRNVWFNLEVRWAPSYTTVWVNGVAVFQDVPQPELPHGQVGLAAHGTPAQFDDFELAIIWGDQPFAEDFADGIAQGWEPQNGQWSIGSGVYRDAAVQQTNVTLAPIHTSLYETFGAELRVKMLNPYGASGNLVGIVFNYGDLLNYNEIVFSPTGIAKINRVDNGVVRTLATAAYNGAANRWFDVSFLLGLSSSVWVDRVKLFEGVDTNPSFFPEGRVGLITHWAPGRFDDVWFQRGLGVDPPPPPETFSAGLPAAFSATGTWNADGGVLKNTSVEMTDRFVLQNRPGFGTVLHARLLNEYGASGNLVGLIYEYQASGPNQGDYYEVLFSTTGRVLLRKVIGGVTYNVMETTHSIPRNTWFAVDVIRDGATTSINVNGTPVTSGVKQGSFTGGAVGAVSHWTKGRFDDFSLTELHPR